MFVHNDERSMFIEVIIFFEHVCMLKWFRNEHFLISFLFLFSFILKRGLCFFLHIVFYITCIPSNIWHMRWDNNFVKNVSSMVFVSVDSRKLTLESWLLQHREVLLFPLHGEHFPGFKVLPFVFLTMLFSILLLPMSSLRVLLRLATVTGPFSNFFQEFINW